MRLEFPDGFVPVETNERKKLVVNGRVFTVYEFESLIRVGPKESVSDAARRIATAIGVEYRVKE
jgi:hypothetical protein